MCTSQKTLDLCAVAVVCGKGTTIGHVPHKISAACLLVLNQKATIIAASQCFSRNLSQGGMEVPCMLIFCSEPKDVDKNNELVGSWPICAKQKMVSGTENENEPPNELRKIDSSVAEVDKSILKDTLSTRWVSLNGFVLTETDRSILTSGK